MFLFALMGLTIENKQKNIKRWVYVSKQNQVQLRKFTREKKETAVSKI